MLPLTPLIDSMRAIALHGASITDVGAELALIGACITASRHLSCVPCSFRLSRVREKTAMAEESSSSADNSNPLAEQSGETLVMWGALVVLASWIIFDVISDEYGVSSLAVALALIIVAIPRIDKEAITGVASMEAFSKAAGYGLAVAGVVELVADIDANIFDAGGSTIIGAIVAYAGYALAFLGARKA